ncbi:MAG: hypothetical protein KBD52_03255 [Candidatus Pacebacteria bacterium]|nr:hypothetical protein [Candidatus Paceibacterota bacterium]
MKKIAFISVFNKEGIDSFAKDLVDLGWDIMSSSGTAKYLKEKGVECSDLADLVGGPILGHRVVSLSREFYAMLLARPDNAEDVEELKRLNLPFISLVCCDMYPLEEEVSKKDATLLSVIEKTDIGGPTMLRAAAKGGRVVVCDFNDRNKVIQFLKNGEVEGDVFKRELAAKAEYIVAKYCMTSAEYLSGGKYKGIFGDKKSDCCYGENGYQTPSSVYQINDSLFSPDKFKLLTETPLSYNNFCDRDKVIQSITHIASGFLNNFDEVLPHIAIAVKHGNACGVGLGDNAEEALQKMIEGDVKAIHGGSIFTNFKIEEKEADMLIHYKMKGDFRRLLDTITSPSFSSEAIEILARKKGKCRIVVNENLLNLNKDSLDQTERERYIRDGFVSQPNYTFVPNFKEAVIESNSTQSLDTQVLKDLVLAWGIGCTSNSNTITIVKDGKLLGNGVGQQDRVGAAKLAIARADDAYIALTEQDGKADLEGTIAYSDSFFPFADGPKVLTDRGVKVIFATSGSVNDKDVIESCKSNGATLVMFPDKVARGFAWH